MCLDELVSEMERLELTVIEREEIRAWQAHRANEPDELSSELEALRTRSEEPLHTHAHGRFSQVTSDEPSVELFLSYRRRGEGTW